MNVILIHGVFDRGTLLAPIAKALEAQGHQCYCPSLTPSSARYGIKDLALKLRNYIDSTLNDEEDFMLIGFSMGCLVSRVYLQELQGVQRCHIFHAIAGPHHGSWWAYLFFWQGAKDMRPNSELLVRLKETQHRLNDMQLHSYRTPYDLMILPSKSSQWAIAKNHITRTALHHLMVKDKTIIQQIINSIPT